jgi:phosphate transport system permease protein
VERLSRKRRWRDRVLRGLLWLCGGATGALLALLIGYVCVKGLRGVTWTFLTTGRSYLDDTNGILPNLFNTLYLIILALAIVLPLGVGAAVYLTEYAARGKLASAIEFAAETLSGIPSIIFGLVGMLVFVQLCSFGTGILAGGLTLAVMVLPVILRTTQESLRAVPQGYREGALALGAGRWRMVYTVVLPQARDGIVTGCILAVGRMVGESAALLFTAGMGVTLNGFFRALTTPSGTLSVALYLYANEYADVSTAMAIAAVLLVMTLVINLAAALVGAAGNKRRAER